MLPELPHARVVTHAQVQELPLQSRRLKTFAQASAAAAAVVSVCGSLARVRAAARGLPPGAPGRPREALAGGLAQLRVGGPGALRTDGKGLCRVGRLLGMHRRSLDAVGNAVLSDILLLP